MITIWMSTEEMTVVADVQGNRIIFASPIIRRFQGQHINNLRRWLRKQGGFKQALLGSSPRKRVGHGYNTIITYTPDDT